MSIIDYDKLMFLIFKNSYFGVLLIFKKIDAACKFQNAFISIEHSFVFQINISITNNL